MMIEAYFCLRFFSFSKSEGDYWIFSHSFGTAVRDINKAAIHAFFSSSSFLCFLFGFPVD